MESTVSGRAHFRIGKTNMMIHYIRQLKKINLLYMVTSKAILKVFVNNVVTTLYKNFKVQLCQK